MTFYKKENAVPTVKSKTAQLSVLPYTDGKSIQNGAIYPEKCLNFRLRSGALRGAFGTKRVFENNPLEGHEVLAAYLFGDPQTDGKILFFTPSGIYHFPLSPTAGNTATPVFLCNYSFSKLPHSFPYVTSAGKKLLIFCTEEGVCKYDGESFSRWASAPPCSTGCTYYDRVFVVSSQVNYRVCFSRPLQQDAWSSNYRASGFVDLFPEQGGILALFPCGKGLYALQEHGLTLLRSEGENFNFTATPVAATFGKVFSSSVQKVGKTLVFLASDGLYAFDGNSVERIAEKLTQGVNFSEESAFISCAYGAYYVLNYATAEGERYTLFFNVLTGEGWFSDINFTAPASDGVHCYFLDGGVLATFTEESARLGQPLKKVWESGYTRLNLGSGRKALRSLTVRGKGKFTLSVRDNSSKEKKYVMALNGETTVQPLIKSTGFLLHIESEDKNCALEGLSATVDFLKEVRGE